MLVKQRPIREKKKHGRKGKHQMRLSSDNVFYLKTEESCIVWDCMAEKFFPTSLVMVTTYK